MTLLGGEGAIFSFPSLHALPPLPLAIVEKLLLAQPCLAAVINLLQKATS